MSNRPGRDSPGGGFLVPQWPLLAELVALPVVRLGRARRTLARAVRRRRRLREGQDGICDGIGHDVERLVVDVVGMPVDPVAVTGEVVARVELTGQRVRYDAAPLGLLERRLVDLGAGRDAPGGDADGRVFVVVGAAVEGDPLGVLALRVEEILEDLLDVARAIRTGDAELGSVAVVDL